MNQERTRNRLWRSALVVVTALAAVLAVARVAGASVTVSRAEMNGSRLRIEGRASANRAITVDGVTMGTSDGSGSFRIERDGFSAPADCTVDVNDGSASPATATLAGCTPATTAAPAPTTTMAPAPTTIMAPAPTTTVAPATTVASSGLRITDDRLPNGNVGTDYTGYIGACCGNGGPYRWSLVAGRVPDGMQFAGDSLRLVQTTAVLGRPTTVQTTTFTVQVRDAAGNTARKTFSLTIDPPRPLVITNQSDALAPGQVGVSYATGVFADGGVPPYRWSLVAGGLPPGLSLTTSPGRITGTPTAAGTFTFTLRVTDNGASRRRASSASRSRRSRTAAEGTRASAPLASGHVPTRHLAPAGDRPLDVLHLGRVRAQPPAGRHAGDIVQGGPPDPRRGVGRAGGRDLAGGHTGASGGEGTGRATGERAGWYQLVGVISSAGFSSGDRFVCGVWPVSPLGPIADLMWATPDGRRRLVAGSQGAAAFVSAVYRFDEVVVDEGFSAAVAGRRLEVEAPGLGLRLQARCGRGWPVPPAPAWVTRYVAGPVARRTLGVRTYGVSPTGVREWYRARWYRPLAEATATVGGRDLGALAPLDPPVGFGFSEPPRRPAMVHVRPLLHDPEGRIAAALEPFA